MPALAHLESLLRERKLDVTLTAAAPWRLASDDRAQTGVPSIDAALGGGLRRGHVSEIVGPRSAGRTALVCHVLAAAAGRGEAVALVDPCDRFDPRSASALGLDLSHLLWIRGSGDPAAAALTGLKAINLVLQAGDFGMVVFDLADVPAPALRAFPFTTWLRMAKVIEGTQGAVLLVGAEHLSRSPGGVTLTLDRPGDRPAVTWSGLSDRARLLGAIELHPRIITAR